MPNSYLFIPAGWPWRGVSRYCQMPAQPCFTVNLHSSSTVSSVYFFDLDEANLSGFNGLILQ